MHPPVGCQRCKVHPNSAREPVAEGTNSPTVMKVSTSSCLTISASTFQPGMGHAVLLPNFKGLQRRVEEGGLLLPTGFLRKLSTRKSEKAPCQSDCSELPSSESRQ